jgi:hypothetical protein
MPRIDPTQPSPSGSQPAPPPSPRAGSPARLTPPQGLQGRASSTGSSLPAREPTPARFAALERADKAASTASNQVMAAPPPAAPEQQYRRDDRLARVRLGLAQELDALTMQDTVPTRHAQHLHADMQHGASLLMAHTTGAPSDQPLEALLQAGLRHNRAAAARQPPDLLPPLMVGTAESAAFARLPADSDGFITSGTTTELGSHRLRHGHQIMIKAGALAPQASMDSRTTVAHEFVHEAQNSRLEPLHSDTEAFSTERQAALVSRQADRLVMPTSTTRPMHMQAGLALSSDTGPALNPDHPHGDSLYWSKPREVHAYLEQSALLRTMAAPGVHQRPATPEVTGLAAAMADQLRLVAHQLAADGNSTPESTVMRFDRHADKFASVSDVMARLANLHGYSQSPAFGDVERRRVQDATAQLASLDGNQPGGTLEQSGDILDTLLEALEDHHGLALEAHGPADAAAFEQGKSQPLAHAAQVLDLDPSQLQKGLDGVFKQGQLQRHVKILDFVRKATPERKAALIQAAVNEQACAWLGLGVGPWQEHKLPPVKVNLYDAPPGPIPSTPGLNAGQGPDRKIEFDPLTWQLHVPAQALQQQPQQLGGPLAKAGLDVAKAAALLAQGQLDTPGVRVQDVDPGHISRHVRAHILVQGPPPGGEQTFPDMHPLLKQALDAGLANPQIDRPGTPWHTGVRPSVKGMAYDGDPGAQTAYRANAAARWEDPLIALRRAVGAAGAAVTPQH